ncbi:MULTISPECIES: diaminopimelate decarboxylase [unclassified Apibacter]|uniref:diaminopimelate decarboxylase n=1 Tax=unclassified Apibacter TaxID=2630820 RepID=UPI001325232B|nr:MULTISPECIES: diaminopimelate decarboxylase [unclassified Apibacter]MCX8676950.1 diaminopimelate decarboxylase [Apibacter sp. B3919]MXO24668.1 diaminopimelate decarboxylase [Apibacter sp. B3924]MXO25912.1 diaminopimelate decarboxylase [Apibacter sp. B3813]MXO27863.1 diaminopimelate decarboxylase [Apibacter sp. B3913]MXO29777.1 diaminopimelate decarboxylase [Apibacter sp. B3912]
MELARIQQLENLAKEFGTPLYVYDADIIKNQYNRLVKAFKSVKKVKLNYACKANTNLNILKFIKSIGSGLDTVSIQEVQLGLRAGFEPKEIIYTPNGVSFQEIKQAVQLGVRINIDNLSILETFGHEIKNYPVCIRINPHIMAGGNTKISTGHIDSKFGISIHQLPHVLRIVNNTGIKVEGVHMHTGSDILDVEVFLKGAEILFNVAKEFHDLDYIDFGSGFKVAYKEGDHETDINYLGKKLGERFNEFQKTYPHELTLMFEPGKFLVSQSGFFIVSVNVIKQTTSTVFAEVDSGFNHLIRPMFYNAHHTITNISNPEGRHRFYTVVGYICETDTFGTNRKISEIHEGDLLCFQNAGAYCFSMSSNYNSRLKPAEVLLINGKPHLIRRRENLDDLLTTTEEISI